MSSNNNNLITMTRKEKWALENKAKSGWRCYFIEREKVHNLSNIRDELREEVDALRNGIENPNYEHLKQMFLNLYEKVGEICDCPICYEPLLKENTFVPNCGHIFCKDCKQRINECPICRKAL